MVYSHLTSALSASCCDLTSTSRGPNTAASTCALGDPGRKRVRATSQGAVEQADELRHS